MQDPSSTYHQVMKPQFPEQEQLKCPRCDSSNTKFCYYNNYNLSQPRHFCKNCRRYWTKGGALRNIPVGGGSRKNSKRSSNNPKRQSNGNHDFVSTRRTQDSAPASAASCSQQLASTSGVLESGLDQDPARVYGLSVDQDRKILNMSGSFSSLLTSSGQLGSILDGLNPSGSTLKMVQMGDGGEHMDSGPALDANSGRDPGMSLQESSNGNGGGGGGGGGDGGGSYCWSGGSNGWPDLAIYTPGSSFQ